MWCLGCGLQNGGMTPPNLQVGRDVDGDAARSGQMQAARQTNRRGGRVGSKSPKCRGLGFRMLFNREAVVASVSLVG